MAAKPLSVAKSRLQPRHQDGHQDSHQDLVLALFRDTLSAITACTNVRSVVLVTNDPTFVLAVNDFPQVSTLPELPPYDLNLALRQGFAQLRARDRGSVIGAIQTDLAALRPDELHDAIAQAAGARAVCVDHAGTGTTLLLSAAGEDLDPRFGSQSASAHLASGAIPIIGALPGLRTDVDTASDLALASEIGVGKHTAAHFDKNP